MRAGPGFRLHGKTLSVSGWRPQRWQPQKETGRPWGIPGRPWSWRIGLVQSQRSAMIASICSSVVAQQVQKRQKRLPSSFTFHVE